MTERGADNLMANPDMLRWRDNIVDLGRKKLFWKPTSMKVDDSFGVHVIDSGRFRMQIYRKTFRELSDGQIDPPETYSDPKLTCPKNLAVRRCTADRTGQRRFFRFQQLERFQVSEYD